MIFEEKDIVLIQFPLEQYTPDEAKQIKESVEAILPNYDILCMPEDIKISFIKRNNDYFC